MTGFRVRKGGRIGLAFAVFRYTAVVQWEGTTELDVAWLSDLEVMGCEPSQVEHKKNQRPLVAHSTAQSS